MDRIYPAPVLDGGLVSKCEMQRDLAYREAPSIDFRTRVVRLAILLGIANIGVWVWAFAALHDNSILLGTALLSYVLGLRHAVDADHIAAIDNVTRKLVDRKSTRLNSSHSGESRMPSSA